MKIILIGIVVTIIGLFLMSTLDNYTQGNSNTSGSPTTEVIEENVLKVEISGEINHPGEYLMESTDTLGQLLDKAGGTTDRADDSAYDPSLELGTRTSFYIPPIFENSDVCVGPDYVKVNINVDQQPELEKVGFNSSQASNLIVYRNVVTIFKAIEDILEVKGIGEATFEKVKNKICIS